MGVYVLLDYSRESPSHLLCVVCCTLLIGWGLGVFIGFTSIYWESQYLFTMAGTSIVSINGIVTDTSVDILQKKYLLANPKSQEVLSSLIPTLFVTLLAILIPLLLLLLAKKAHNIVLLSKLHDQIMTRYHKFLVCKYVRFLLFDLTIMLMGCSLSVLIFFCVGVSALQAFLQSFRQTQNTLRIVADKFPEAAPFYVGWCMLCSRSPV